MKKEDLFTDPHGYQRFKNNPKKLVHRNIAYNYIYLKDRGKYPLDFKEYQVHHKDGNKNNNHSDNLKLKEQREHEKEHNIHRFEYAQINSLWIFVILGLIWYGYLGWASGYTYNLKDVAFMSITLILANVLLYFVNKKKKGRRYV